MDKTLKNILSKTSLDLSKADSVFQTDPSLSKHFSRIIGEGGGSMFHKILCGKAPKSLTQLFAIKIFAFAKIMAEGFVCSW